MLSALQKTLLTFKTRMQVLWSPAHSHSSLSMSSAMNANGHPNPAQCHDAQVKILELLACSTLGMLEQYDASSPMF